MSIEAMKHYEAALKAAFPSGATGDVFHHWNEARKAIEQAEQAQPVAWATRLGEYAHIQWGSKRPEYPMVYEVPLYTAPPQRQPLTADEMKEPKNGEQWHVVWWNESCRMVLPSDAKLDSFTSYKNGTLQFTIKKAAHGIYAPTGLKGEA